MFDEEILRSIMMTCIILHNMIVKDEYDYDALEVYEPDPMNTALTRIYESLMGPSGEPFELEPLVRDGLGDTQSIQAANWQDSGDYSQPDLLAGLDDTKSTRAALAGFRRP
ncbi:hypothetical protein L3X38_039040 [Prunus dulcis]|uniref:Uncharacterized protein n=1 Tax=Prunus dulcis TaxID=3755 RepID=A0AAD4V7Y5_PRUDU|nr:hypothetical protein L3X38_039040 [Prunus dulcis]